MRTGRGVERKGSGARWHQRGAFMVEMSLALVLAAAAAAVTVRENVRNARMASATTDAEIVALYRQALQDYVDDGYASLQRVEAPVRNGVSPADPMAPTVPELIGMGYLTPGFSGALVNVDGANLANRIVLEPAACAPATACTVHGVAWIDQPVLQRGTGEVDNLVIGQFMAKLGVSSGTSFEDAPNQVIGTGGAWTIPNPIGTNPPGVVAARFGSGFSMMASFLRMNDNRDPGFQNNVSMTGGVLAGGASTFGSTVEVTGAATLNSTLAVAGATTLSSGLAVTGATNLAGTLTATGRITGQADVGATDVGGCLRAALESGGAVVSRAADCLQRSRLDNNGVALSDAGGVLRAELLGTGTMVVRNAGGAQTIGADGAAGRLTAQLLNVTAVGNSGAACASENDLALDASATGTVLICRSGVWRRPGLMEAVVGDGCAVPGQLGQTSTSETLICRGGTWRFLNDRVSTVVAMDIWSGNGTGAVPNPACGLGGTPDIAVSALHGGADYGGVPPRNRFEFRVSGGGPWTVDPVMVDATGAAFSSDFSGATYNLGWTAVTYCRYTA